MAMKTLDDLFVHFLRDIYHAEKQTLRTMRQIARGAQSQQLRELLEEHREETEGQVETLEKVFEQLGIRPRGTRCEAIEGILNEAGEIMEAAEQGPVRDAAMIAAVQAVEHYEITRYGTMISWAKTLGRDEVAEMLIQTLEQEIATDKRLTEVAEASLNEEAQQRDGAGGEAEEAMQEGGGQGGRGGAKGGRGKGAQTAQAVDEEEPEQEEAAETNQRRGGGRKSKAA